MVDEYQDVNQVQDTIFRAISRGGKNLFMVGDVKQSIYRFRLADPGIFTEKYLSYKDDDKAPYGESRRIMLQENFRSRREIEGNAADAKMGVQVPARPGEKNILPARFRSGSRGRRIPSCGYRPLPAQASLSENVSLTGEPRTSTPRAEERHAYLCTSYRFSG